MSRKDIEKLIVNYERRLQKLKEQQALRGLNTPPDILIEIEDIEARLEELQAELEALSTETPPLDTTSESDLYYPEIEEAVEQRRKEVKGASETSREDDSHLADIAEAVRKRRKAIEETSEISREVPRGQPPSGGVGGPDSSDGTVPPSKRFRRAFSQVWHDVPTRWVLISILVASLAFLGVLYYFSLTVITPEKTTQFGLGYMVEYPSQLVVRENEQFSITLINRKAISLTQVSATLVFSDALPISADTTVAQFEDLASGERRTREITFTLNRYVPPPVQAELRANADQFGTTPLGSYKLSIAPFPQLKTFGSWLFGSLSAGLTVVLLWMLRGTFRDVFPGK